MKRTWECINTRAITGFVCILLVMSLLAALLAGCELFGGAKTDEQTVFTSYKDIPGIEQAEIDMIEAAIKSREHFDYGVLSNVEAFVSENGDVRGFSAIFCEWLSELFGIPFIPFRTTWTDMIEGLENGGIDFIGNLTPTEERMETYFMTEPIIQRTVKCIRLADSEPIDEIARTRPPKYAFLDGAALIDIVSSHTDEEFEIITVTEYIEAFDLLKNGEIDALIAENTVEAVFVHHKEVVTEDFFPMIYIPVSFTTGNPELAAFISVVQKAIDNSYEFFLADLYDEGYLEYKKYKLFLTLTAEEREHIRRNPEVLFGAAFDNYPMSFYDTHNSEWQGISHDVIGEIEVLTGLDFSIVNDEGVGSGELLRMLESGEVHCISEVIWLEERAERFTWTNEPLHTDQYVLISKTEYPDIGITGVHYARVGMSKGSAFSDYFFDLFPNHQNYVLYDSKDESFEALINGEVDMVMSSYSTLRYLTNYRELPGYKANVIFDETFKWTYGVNTEQTLLLSIIEKAMQLIDIDKVSAKWLHRSYDYRAKIVEEQRPLMISTIILSLSFLAIVTVMLVRNMRRSKAFADLSHWYKSILDAIPLPVAVFDPQMKLTFANKEATIFANAKSEDLIGAHSSAYLPEIHSSENGGEYFDEHGIKHKYFARGDLQYQVNLDSIKRSSGKTAGYIDVIQDITELKRVSALEEAKRLNELQLAETEKLRQQAEAANVAKSSFLATMSHEIRTPMNAILGITEILTQRRDLSDDALEGLEKIYNSGNMLLGIINDILDFSKIEAGKLDIIPAEYHVASLINDSVNLNMMRIKDKPIEFALELSDNIPSKLVGDELRIKQILNNILSNACKYTDSGKITLSINREDRDTVNTTTDEVVLVISVQDTGHGMTKEQVSKLFDEYSRFDTARKTTIEGTGLGMAITNNLLSLMRGEILVESEPEEGTLITIKLPQTIVDDKVLEHDVLENLRNFRLNYMEGKKDAPVKNDLMPYGRVLVVDDVETNLYVAAGLMNPYGLKVDTVMSGSEAIEKTEEGNEYDIIFMDHMMPDMDGMEATKILRDKGYAMPIVALTANAVAGQADVFLSNGFDAFISKPIDTRELKAVLHKYVRDKQPAEAKKEADHVQAAHMIGSEAKRDKRIMELFIKDAKKAIPVLEKYHPSIEDDMLRLFAISVHGMRSGLASIGEPNLSKTAHILEKAAKNRLKDVIDNKLPDFLVKLKELVAEND